MTGREPGAVLDPELDSALVALLAQAEREPISRTLRELTKRLETALHAARQRREEENRDTA